MTPESWQRVKELFGAAVALNGPDRDAFLASACGADLQIRAELDRLLAQHDRAGRDPPISRTFAAGDIVGSHFVIESLLGAGGMGEVTAVRL